MEGFAEVSTEKVNIAITNFDKLQRDLDTLEEGLRPQIEEEVATWGWYSRWAYSVGKVDVMESWMSAYNHLFDSSFNTYAQQGLVSPEVAGLYNEAFYARTKRNDLITLLKASSKETIHVNETLSRFINRYKEEVTFEQQHNVLLS